MKIQTSLILLTITVILHAIAASPDKDNKLIETTCRNTPDYKLCTSILRSNPTSGSADLPELGLMVVGVVKKKAKEAVSMTAKLARSGQTKLLPALRLCTEVYKAVLEGDVPVATQAIRGNPKFAETAVADAGAEADVCGRALEEVGAGKLALGEVNRYVHDVADVARAIIRNLL